MEPYRTAPPPDPDVPFELQLVCDDGVLATTRGDARETVALATLRSARVERRFDWRLLWGVFGPPAVVAGFGVLAAITGGLGICGPNNLAGYVAIVAFLACFVVPPASLIFLVVQRRCLLILEGTDASIVIDVPARAVEATTEFCRRAMQAAEATRASLHVAVAGGLRV